MYFTHGRVFFFGRLASGDLSDSGEEDGQGGGGDALPTGGGEDGSESEEEDDAEMLLRFKVKIEAAQNELFLQELAAGQHKAPIRSP